MRTLLNMTMDDISAVSSIGEKKEVATTKSKFNIKNYLNTKLDDSESSRKTSIRILPIDNATPSPFKEVYMHNVKVDSEIAKSGFKNYICLEKTKDDGISEFGNKCPFCELNRSAYNRSVELRKNGDEYAAKEYEKVSIANIAKPATILRCIERGGMEVDGPKFWKINIRKDKGDAYNTIMNEYTLRAKHFSDLGLLEPINLFDVNQGLDLILTFEASKDADGKRKVSTKITPSMGVTPLSASYDNMVKWINDEKKWYEVFPPKPYEYTALIIEGKIPWFDNKSGKWVAKEELITNNDTQSVVNAENNAIDDIQNRYTQSTSSVVLSDTGEIVDDLPF